MNQTDNNDVRMIDRQDNKTTNISEEEIERAYKDFESGSEQLHLHSLKFFVDALKSDNNKMIVTKYGKELIGFFLIMSEHGLTDEIQALALICVSLCYEHQILTLKAISKPEYIGFLINKKLMHSIPEANAVLHILSTIVSEKSKFVEIILGYDIFKIIPNLPPETEFGELVDVLLQQIVNVTPEINSIVSLIPMMLSSPNSVNVCHGLQCVNILISRNWNCFDFDDFHSTFPQFLLSENPAIASTAFSLLRKFPPNEDDIKAVLQRISNGGNISLHAISYFIDTQQLWENSPSPDLFNCIISCISKSKYNVVSRALKLLMPSLKASGLKFDSSQVQQLCNFLSDKDVSQHILPALCFIWDRIQTTDNTDWFTEEIGKYDSDIEELTSSSNDEIAELASKLLQIM